jgi:hypothetical protein
MILTLIASTLALGIAGDDHAGSSALDEALAGFERSGETRSCLSVRLIDEIKPVDDTHWLVTTRGRETYLNTVSRGCRNADSSFTYLQYSTPTSSLCRGEIVRVVDSSSRFTQGSCSIGDFEILTPVE